MEIRFHLDEHVDPAIAEGLRRRGINVSTTLEAGLISAPDEAHIGFALSEGRVIVTHDRGFLRLHTQGVTHAGIAYSRQGARSVGELVRTLILIRGCLTAEEMHRHVEYL